MLVKTADLTNSNKLISHAVLESLDGNSEAMKIVKDRVKNRTDKDCKDIEYDVKLIFEDHELNIVKFFELLERSWDSQIQESAKKQAQELFETYKHSYNSKNSTNAKLEKVKKQLDKVTLELQNVNLAINNLK